MKNIIYKTLFLLAIFASVTSCDKIGDPEAGGTSTEQMAGDWYVQTYTKGDAPSGDYALISTHNTSLNKGKEMWVDDHENIWTFKAKTPISLSDLAFSGKNLPSSVDGYDITVTITNGLITINDTETSGGNISNGISFDIEFSDEPGVLYTISGYKYLGFLEDQH
jgi:hypothetical protein